MQIEITKEVAAKVLKVVDRGLSNGLGNPKPGEMCVEAAVCYALGLPHGDDPGCVAPVLRSLKIRLNDSNWSSKQARARGLRRLAVAQLGSKDHLDEKEFRKRIVDYALRVSVPSALRSAASVQKDEKHKAALCEAANRCEKEASREAAIDARAIARAAAYAAADAAAAAAAYAAAAAAYAAAAADADAAAYAYAAAAAAAADAAAAAAAADADAAAAAAAAAAYAYAYAAAAAAAADAAAAAAAADADAAAAAYAYAAAAAAAADAAAAAAAADADAKKSARDKSLADYAEAVVQILVEMKAPGCQWLELTEIAA